MNKYANIISGFLCLCFFLYLCDSSYKKFKEQKDVATKIEALKAEIADLKQAIKKPISPHVEMEEPSKWVRQAAKVPIIHAFDVMTACTGQVVWLRNEKWHN